jgi:hypothetical protein
MTTSRPISSLFAVSLILCASVASADVMNGDFENGGNQWQVNVPQGWTSAFPAAGGNPGGLATIQSPFGGPGGLGCIMQTFICGDPGAQGTCTITVDYALDQIDASDDSARIVIHVNGAMFTFAPDDEGWHTATLTVPCGVVVLELCLQVDPQNNGWRASFDNVEASCDGVVSSEATNWSTIKALYN